MTSRQRHVRFVVIAVSAIVVLALALFVASRVYGPAKGMFFRTFYSPAVLRDPSVQALTATTGKAQRDHFMQVYLSHKGAFGLSQRVSSVEGTPIGMTLLVRDGALTLVLDYTRDSFGIRKFRTVTPSYVDLGSVLEPQLHPLDDRFPKEGPLYLRCYLESGRVMYF